MARKNKKAVTPATDANAHALKADAQPIQAAPAVEAAPEAPAVEKVTKRSQVLTNAKIVLGDKPNKMRAGHNTKVWDAVAAILPSTAAEIMKLAELNEPPIVAGVMLSYMLRRGYLKLAE